MDKSKPGFKVRVVQASNKNGELANKIARAEDQLAGLLVDTSTGLFYANIADTASFNPDGSYDEPGTIAYATGAFPGIPGSEGHSVNISLEAITFADLAPGTYSMVVNSDDGFRVTAGNVYDRLQEIELGKFDDGRGAGDTEFKFTVTKAGVYGFRLVYEQGGGGFSVDWYTADVSDPATRVHLNEAGGVPSYRALTSSTATRPAISAISPLNGSQGVPPSQPFIAQIKNGTTSVNPSTLKVFRNDVDVTAQAEVSTAGDTITVRHFVATLPDPLSQVRYKLAFADNGTPPVSREAQSTYTVGPYANYTLPAPIWLETFDTTNEGATPAGWKLETPMDLSGTEDLDDPGSDSYQKFVVISRDRISALGAAGRWDGARRLNSPEAYINGQRVSGLIQTNFLYGESDTRGGSQVQFAYSPTVNLTGKTDIYLVYNSIYEQNQDSLGGVEYSIDSGKTWLPVVYMIDVPDVQLKADGTVDPEATLTRIDPDGAAKFIDPVTGEESDGSYGSFIGAAKPTWKDLGPYISGRVNDNATESKRIEKFRLPQADNQPKVSFRIVHAGTGSWYFGVDNFGVYSITTIDPPAIVAQPASITRFAGTKASFTVGVNGQQLTYKWQLNGKDLPNSNTATYEIVSVAAVNAGEYRAIVTSPSGSVTSAIATLTVNAFPTDNSTLRTDLSVYLPLDSNYNDISGKGHNGSAVGSPTFAAGKVGAGAVKVSSVRSSSTYNFVTLGLNAAVPFGQTKDCTVAFWMKTERVDGDPSIVANKNWGSGNNPGWTIGTQTDGRIEWNYRRTNADGLSRKDLDYTAEGNILAKPEWVHVTVVWKINGAAETYFNGLMVDSRSIAPGTGDAFDPTVSLNLGQDGTGAYTDGEWDGQLDEVAFWDRGLTATEVATVFGYGYRGESFLAEPSTQPTIAYTVAGAQLTMNWQGSGFVLQENADLGNTAGWAPVAGAGANSATVPTSTGVKFYRLKK